MARETTLLFDVLEGTIDNRGKTPPLAHTGYPLVEVKHIQSGRLYPVLEDTKFVDQNTWDSWFRGHLQPEDILFSTVGSIARSCIVPKGPKFCIAQNVLGFRVDKSKADSRYVYYAINGEFFQHEVNGRTIETVQKSIKVYDLKTARIPLPPLPEQRAIAHILGTLDDKIELNRRMNETLEAMARALFKSWFIDFDPVRAKHALSNVEGAKGRAPGLPKHIADLFPDSFQDSDQGKIPKGWQVKSVGDLADVVGGSTPSTTEVAYWEGGAHAWATPKDLSALSVPVLLDTERGITDAGLAQISCGLLPKGTVLLSSRAPIGYLAVAEVPVAINQGFIAMKPKAGTSNLFLLFWASGAHDEIVSRANGSTFLEISKANFRPIPVVTPSDYVMQKFEQLARPLYGRIVESAHESRTLAALRDKLLPKLISGELRLKNAKELVGGI